MKDSIGHSVHLRVRYSETDQMKVVYHGSYIPYFEISRVEWLRSKGKLGGQHKIPRLSNDRKYIDEILALINL